MKEIILVLSGFLLLSSCTEMTQRTMASGITELSQPSDNFEPYLREIFSGDLGYALLGEKPISFTSCYNLDFYPQTKQSLFTYLKTIFCNSPRFILKIFDQKYCPHRIILVDKSALIRLIDREFLLHNFIKEKYGDIGNFFRDLENPDKDIIITFRFDYLLLGIALGYGKSNSEFFMRRCFVSRYLRKWPALPFELPLFHPEPFSFHPAQDILIQRFLRQYASDLNPVPYLDIPRSHCFEQEWQWIEENRVPIKYSSPPILSQEPIFIACKGPETDEILQRFSIATNRLAKMIAAKHLKTVLSEEAKKKL